MKKILSAVLLIFVIISCKENVEPFAGYKEKYVVFCALDIDSLYQSVVVSKNYSINEFNNPSTSHEIKDATVRITSGSDVINFTLTKTERIQKDRYADDLYYYANNNFRPKENTQYFLEVVLSNGEILKGTCITPKKYVIIQKIDSSLPTTDEDYGFLMRYDDNQLKYFYYPKFEVYYNEKINGIWKKKNMNIPAYMNNRDGLVSFSNHKVDIYPFAYFNNDALRYKMQEFAKKSEPKENYQILLAEYVLYVMEEHLGKYFVASKADNSNLTAIVDTYDYSNISGGYGIFGAFYKWSARDKRLYVKFNFDYIKELGFDTKYIYTF